MKIENYSYGRGRNLLTIAGINIGICVIVYSYLKMNVTYSTVEPRYKEVGYNKTLL